MKRLTFLLMWNVYPILGNFYIPDLPQKRYIELRDINVGAIFPIYSYDSVKPCGDRLRSTVILQFIEALVYAVDKVNDDGTLLPQTKLGFVILDDCLKTTTTIAQSLSFLPQINDRPGNETCQSSASNLTAIPIYDVIGVIGSMKSSNTIAAATLLGPALVPQVSYSSSSDQLTDKVLYPYFMRVVPPDKFQVEGIVTLVSHFGWKYLSVIYSEGSYGEIAFKNLKKRTDELDICIGMSRKIAEDALTSEYDKIALDLRDVAKVVIMFTGPTHAKGLFAAVSRAKDTRKYVWIGSDGWAKRINNLGDFWEIALGAFTFTFYSEEVPEFTNFFKSKDPLTDNNPWLKEFWEDHFSCSLDLNATTPCDMSATLSSDNGFQAVPTVTPVMDAVLTFAHALHNLLAKRCPDKMGTAVRSCVDGPTLLSHMKNLTFTGYNGRVSFDASGNLLGKYMVDQLVRNGDTYKQIKIGTYDSVTDTMIFNSIPVTWDYVDTEDGDSVPESICSKPCGPREFIIQKELPCCWECKACRNNEFLTDNSTNCSPCPLLSWPDPLTNFKSCVRIQATYILWGEPLAVMLLAFAALGVVGAGLVFGLYVYHNNSKCIKASSREMSYLMLVGVFLGYITVAGLVAPPSDTTCKVNYVCFCVSFTWIYSPLLTRTTRIYRIFESSSKSNKRPSFISPRSQVVIASSLIAIQIALCLMVSFVFKPNSQLSMPVPTDRYVELSCDFTLPGIASFLSYNLILVFACSFFAFKTRKLPDNFNECRFILMCVYTTLVLLVSFIPSYFTAGRQYLRTVMLSTVLILNKTVALCFLYLPKIYAAIYLEKLGPVQKATSRFSRQTNTTTTTISTNATPHRNVNFLQVEPVG